MILTRLGNKRRMKTDLAKYFPKHRMRIELFFGAGGSYFYLPQPKYAIVNDLDDDVTNLYMLIQNDIECLKQEIEKVPISESLIKYWKQNQETDPVKKAVRFLLLSNFSYMGKGDTLRAGLDNAKTNILKNMYETFKKLQNVKIMNRDFREVLPAISFSKGLNDKEEAFVYLDPIYFGTEHYYRVPKWNAKDTTDCLDIMLNCGIKSAMSEFDHPFVIAEAEKRGLNVIFLRERANIKNRRVEILITNYQIKQGSFDFKMNLT
ncbi:DNA adenine methylase [Flavobacterium mesophilum]|uniref:DNA adenine methylase n=1 Tax=Flavobacterium mesophilum TaxID=3143495 RepID=UPI0031D09FBE